MNSRWLAGLIVFLVCVGLNNVCANPIEISGNAKILWSKYIPEMYDSYTLGDDYNGDKLPDIIAVGEKASVLVVSGKDGNIVWSKKFEGYEDAWAESAADVNGDGTEDLVVYLYNWSNEERRCIALLKGIDGEELWKLCWKINWGSDSWYYLDVYTVGDVNGDGKSEIILENESSCCIFNKTEGYEICYDNTTIDLYDWVNDRVIWNKQYRGWARPIPAGDFNGDGRKDIIVIHEHHEYLGYSEALDITNGNTLWNVTGFAVPIDDINGDGRDDAVVGEKEHVIMINGDRSKLWSTYIGDYNWIEPYVVGDLDGDGKPDVIAVSCKEWEENDNWYRSFTVIAISNGKILWTKTWDDLLEGWADVRPAGDLNGDSRQDILGIVGWCVNTTTWEYKTEIYGLNAYNGSTFWSLQSSGWIGLGLMEPIGDFDDNGRYDIALNNPISVIYVSSLKQSNKDIEKPYSCYQTYISIKQSIKSDQTYEIRAFTGDNINSTIWKATSERSLGLVFDIALWSYWKRGLFKKPGVDYNGDGVTDVGILSEDTIYVLTRNVSSTGNGAVIINSKNSSLIWDNKTIPCRSVILWNGTYSVPIEVENVRNVTGLHLNLTFDSNVIKIVSIKSNSSVYYVVENGSVRIVLTNTSGITAKEHVIVANIVFKPINTGFTFVNITYAEFSDENFNPFKPDIMINGSIKVTMKGDFNGNDRIDVGDVAYVAYTIIDKLPKDPRADFNNNGRVDIGDLAKIAYHLLGKIREL